MGQFVLCVFTVWYIYDKFKNRSSYDNQLLTIGVRVYLGPAILPWSSRRNCGSKGVIFVRAMLAGSFSEYEVPGYNGMHCFNHCVRPANLRFKCGLLDVLVDCRIFCQKYSAADRKSIYFTFDFLRDCLRQSYWRPKSWKTNCFDSAGGLTPVGNQKLPLNFCN